MVYGAYTHLQKDRQSEYLEGIWIKIPDVEKLKENSRGVTREEKNAGVKIEGDSHNGPEKMNREHAEANQTRQCKQTKQRVEATTYNDKSKHKLKMGQNDKSTCAKSHISSTKHKRR